MAAVSVRKKKSFAKSPKPVVRMCMLDREEQMSMASPGPVWPIPMRAIGAQNLLTMPGGVTTSGYLHKKGGSQFSLMKWPLRFIIIHKGCVYYFKSSTSASPQGAFSLNGYHTVMRAAEETTSSNVFPFKIVHFSKKHRTWLFSAASEEERRSWMWNFRREINHYNDRKESHPPSSDTDSDSFYEATERPMDIKPSADNVDDDYMEEDDDEDDEDYLKPDSSPPPTGRPTGPPPSYPPPPVPAFSNKLLPLCKAPPLPPPNHRIPPCPLPKKLPLPALPSPPIHKGPPPQISPALRGLPPPPTMTQTPSHKGPPPDVPSASCKQRSTHFSSGSPSLPPPNPRWTVSKPAPGQGSERPPLPALHTLPAPPFCEQLESRLRLNRSTLNTAHSPAHNNSPTHTLSHSPTRNNSPTHTLSQRPAHNNSPTHTLSHSPTRNNSPIHTLSQRPALNNSPTQTLSHSPARNNSPTHTLSQRPALNNSPTQTLSHSPACNNSPTHTLSQRPAHNNSPAQTLSCSPVHNNSPPHPLSQRPTFNNSPSHSPTPTQRPANSLFLGSKLQPQAKPGPAQICLKPKPPSPMCKPPIPSSRKPTSTTSLGRVSPEGQSFRSSAEEVPADLRCRWDSTKHKEESDEDKDYENVQLPDSVFIDTTETSFVEKLFRESEDCSDGLYAIRNSGTKTSKVLVVWDISICKARNYRLFEENGCIFLDHEVTFPSLAILIEHYYSHALPQHGSLCLQRPYTKIS